MRFRTFLCLLCGLLLLSGCGETVLDEQVYSHETVTFAGEGYTLTYPACFTLVGQTKQMVNFAVPGGNMAFTVTAEINPHGVHEIGEYPDLMGIYDGVIPLNDHSFAVEKYLPDILSAYYLYAVTPEQIYLLEYNFGGTAAQREMESLFALDPIDNAE